MSLEVRAKMHTSVADKKERMRNDISSGRELKRENVDCLGEGKGEEDAEEEREKGIKDEIMADNMI